MNENDFQPQQQQPAAYGAPQPKRGKGLGIAAMVLGIIGAVLSFIPVINILSFPLVIVGLILGIVSLVLARGGQGPKGFGIAGIACSVVALVITIVMYMTLATAAVLGTAAVDYLDENASIGVGSSENVEVKSIAWLDDNTLTVELENTSSKTIGSVIVALPLYNADGKLADTATGTVSDVAPGTFTVDIKTILTANSDAYTFNESELVITTL